MINFVFQIQAFSINDISINTSLLFNVIKRKKYMFSVRFLPYFFTYIICWTYCQKLSAKWQADAGIVYPHTQNALLQVSSGTGAEKVRDGDENTFWQSEAPFPEAYIRRPDLNVFYNMGKHQFCSGSGIKKRRAKLRSFNRRQSQYGNIFRS